MIVADPHDATKGYVQPGGPFKGFFVAMTSLRHPGGDTRDPATYVDATHIPYIVLPTGFTALPHVARVGDVGLATELAGGRSTPFIVGDSGGGGDAKLGEASIALFTALGFPNANPRTGAGLPHGAIQYVVFPGSHRAGAAIWPRTMQDIGAQVDDLIAHTPGIG